MTWDSQNRMVGCQFNNQTSVFTYGADGLRRSMTVSGGSTTDYAYDGQSMVREMQVNPTTGSLVSAATYLTGPRGPEYRRDDTQTDSIRWYVYDGLGSVVGEVDPLGNLTCSDEYDVYGAVRGRVGTASTAHGFVGSLGHLSDVYSQSSCVTAETDALGRTTASGAGCPRRSMTVDGVTAYSVCDGNAMVRKLRPPTG